MPTIQEIPDLPGDDLSDEPGPTPVGEPQAELVEVAINREAMVVTFRYRIRREMSDGSYQDLGATGANLPFSDAEAPALEVLVGGNATSAKAILLALNKSANRIRVAQRDGLGPYATPPL